MGGFLHTGTVTTVSPNRNFSMLEHDGRPHFHYVTTNRFNIFPGDRVEVKGDAFLLDNGDVHEIAQSVKRIGRFPLPPPKNVPLAKLPHRDFLWKRVSTEGTLILARRDEIDPMFIQLLVKEGPAVLNASLPYDIGRSFNVFALLGAKVGMTGIMAKSSGARRSRAAYLEIDPVDGFRTIQPPPADIFDVPRLEFNAYMTPDEIVRKDFRRFDGVVTATWDGNRMMVSGRDFHRVMAILSRPEELPEVGQCVSAVGIPDTDSYGIKLIYARCKPLPEPKPSFPVLDPVEMPLEKLLTDELGRPRINGYSHGRLIRIRGTVLDVQRSLAVFSLNQNGLTLPVDCSSSPKALQILKAYSFIEAVVLAIPEADDWSESIVLPDTRGLKLILRSAEDLKILSSPPWWTPARLIAAIITLLVAIVFIIITNRIINRIALKRKISERTRLAVELHDSLSQTLVGVACQIAAGHDAITDDPETAKSLLATAERMLQSGRTELKNCLFDLRNDTVDDPDFARAISTTLSTMNPEADISVRFKATRSMMTDTTAHAILRIIRELVSNAIRHGKATRIRVAGVEHGHLLRFAVRDNGHGFDPESCRGPRDGHFGLAGIRERLNEIGGKLAIKSSPGNGSRAVVSVKLRDNRDQETPNRQRIR